jgi:hypothetical protein
MVQLARVALGVAALSLLLVAGAASAQDPPAERTRAAGAGGETPLANVAIYRVTGVRESAGAATVFHCTNLGAANASITINIRDFDGVQLCSMSFAGLPTNQTATFATSNTTLFEEDRICSNLPAVDGYAVLLADNVGSTRLICTAQVLDPVAATPVFATTLDLFRP